jgi:hypothetical protein
VPCLDMRACHYREFDTCHADAPTNERGRETGRHARGEAGGQAGAGAGAEAVGEDTTTHLISPLPPPASVCLLRFAVSLVSLVSAPLSGSVALSLTQAGRSSLQAAGRKKGEPKVAGQTAKQASAGRQAAVPKEARSPKEVPSLPPRHPPWSCRLIHHLIWFAACSCPGPIMGRHASQGCGRGSPSPPLVHRHCHSSLPHRHAPRASLIPPGPPGPPGRGAEGSTGAGRQPGGDRVLLGDQAPGAALTPTRYP